ncbi:MAG: hypothetical protein IPF68_19740 [Bacteroidales bacterium]|nr:hypothetical protein [Bacteroidales bacterium]
MESDGDYTYTPDAGYNGTDIVVVSVCDNGTHFHPVYKCYNYIYGE